MQIRLRYVLLLLLCLAATPASAQETAPEVRVQLSLAEGKSVYRAGEPIRLVLSFTATADGYLLNITTTKPASPVDEIVLSPKSRAFNWLDQYSRHHRYTPDHSTQSILSTKPTQVELPLNDWFRFDQPGKYFVRVKTNRVSAQSKRPHDFGPPLPLTTNEVSFEVKPMSQDEESAEVRRLAALLNAAKGWQEEARISEQLSFLTGDEATREKVRQFLASGGRSGNYFQNIFYGLFMARNQRLVIELLEDALRDPKTEVTHSLVTTLTRLRSVQQEADSSVARSQTFEEDQRRSAEIQEAYLRELVAGLSKREGKSRAGTAMTILTLFPRANASNATAFSSIREILIQDFAKLHAFHHEYLLRVYWEQLRDPALLPALRQILNQKDLNLQTRSIAMKRFRELAPDEARPFIIEEMRDPRSLVDLEVLFSLSDASLPELDEILLEQIRVLAPSKANTSLVLLKHKTALAARYATPAIYGSLLETYQTWGGKWQPDARANLLAYIAKHNEDRALPLIEQALAELAPGQYHGFLSDLTKAYYSEAIGSLLRKRLESDDPEAVSNAAYLISRHGRPEDWKVVAARLQRWLKEWSERAAELNLTEGNDKAVIQGMVQVNLIEALTRAKAWKLPDDQIKQLQQSCITQTCRRHFPAQ